MYVCPLVLYSHSCSSSDGLPGVHREHLATKLNVTMSHRKSFGCSPKLNGLLICLHVICLSMFLKSSLSMWTDQQTKGTDHIYLSTCLCGGTMKGICHIEVKRKKRDDLLLFLIVLVLCLFLFTSNFFF